VQLIFDLDLKEASKTCQLLHKLFESEFDIISNPKSQLGILIRRWDFRNADCNDIRVAINIIRLLCKNGYKLHTDSESHPDFVDAVERLLLFSGEPWSSYLLQSCSVRSVFWKSEWNSTGLFVIFNQLDLGKKPEFCVCR
jgi:hypothetical protein